MAGSLQVYDKLTSLLKQLTAGSSIFCPILLLTPITLMTIFHRGITTTNVFSFMKAHTDTERTSGLYYRRERVKYHKNCYKILPLGIYRRRCVQCKSVHSGSKDSMGSQTVRTSYSCSCHLSRKCSPTTRIHNQDLRTQFKIGQSKVNVSKLPGTQFTRTL